MPCNWVRQRSSKNIALYVTESSDGRNIYTTVLTDGSTSGSGGAGCNFPNAKHTPVSYNSIGSINSKLSGSPNCMTCYLSVQNDQQIAGTPGVIYTFTGSGEVDCSQFGTFWGNLFSFQAEVAGTHSKTTSSTPGGGGSQVCSLQSWCTPATTPPDCNPSYTIQEPLILGGTASCSLYYDTTWLAERKSPASPGAPWTCLPLVPGQNASGNQNGSLGVCTKNP